MDQLKLGESAIRSGKLAVALVRGPEVPRRRLRWRIVHLPRRACSSDPPSIETKECKKPRLLGREPGQPQQAVNLRPKGQSCIDVSQTKGARMTALGRKRSFKHGFKAAQAFRNPRISCDRQRGLFRCAAPAGRPACRRSRPAPPRARRVPFRRPGP
jgi:hypothetical protein